MGQLTHTTSELDSSVTYTEALTKTPTQINDAVAEVESGGLTQDIVIYGTNAAGDTIVSYTLSFTDGRLTTF